MCRHVKAYMHMSEFTRYVNKDLDESSKLFKDQYFSLLSLN